MRSFKKVLPTSSISRRFARPSPLSPTSPSRSCVANRELFSRHQGGRIELIIGPMFAGKTTELMRRIRREIFACRRCFVIKYGKDTRYSQDAMSSHDKAMLKAHASVNVLSEVGNDWKDFDVIGIDEGQFFSDLLEFSTAAADAGKTVIISALDGDFCRRPFGQVCSLVPHCESVDKLAAVCMVCHQLPGCFTRRTVTDNNEQELIGGADMYVATCRECFDSSREVSPTMMEKYKETIRRVEASFTSKSPSPSSEDACSTRSSEGQAGSPSPQRFKEDKGIHLVEEVSYAVPA